MDVAPLIKCPRCGKSGQFHHVEIEDNNPGLAMLMFGGVWAYLLSRRSSDNMVICDRCHYVFKSNPPFGRDDVVGWIAIILILGLAGTAIYFAMHYTRSGRLP